MEKITINKDLEVKVKEYARLKKISQRKALERLFDKGVCHLLNQKKSDNMSHQRNTSEKNLFGTGVCHPTPRIKRIIIVEVA